MQTANRTKGLRESVIREMTRLALQHDAINLSQGFPDFDPPRAIIDAAHRALDAGHNQYAITWGVPPLREAIRAKMKKWYGLEYDPVTQITVTCGVTEAIDAAIRALTNPGDEVVIIEPYHENYLATVALAGAVPVFAPLEPPNYELDARRLRRVFTSRTRALILNSPHNPTGRVFTRTEMQAVAQLCDEFDVVVITDEIYDQILYDDQIHIPFATLDGMYERTITIGGLGKTFAVTGWRLGYACAPLALSPALRIVHDFSTICAPTPLQYAAAAALELPEPFWHGLKKDYTARREKMMGILEEAELRAQPPQGAYYVMADFGAWLPRLRSRQGFAGDDFAFAHYMTREVGVAVVPGSNFYSTPGLGTTQVRFAFAKRLETLDRAEERLRAARR